MGGKISLSIFFEERGGVLGNRDMFLAFVSATLWYR